MNIPNQAKKVFTGKIFDVYQWEQELFDGSTATFEMVKRPNTVQIIPVTQGNIFLGKEQQPTHPLCYTLIGGRQDPGETPLEAAQRELLEETGMTSDDFELLHVMEPYTKIDWEIYTYVARNAQRTQDQLLDPGEKIEIVQASFEEFCTIVFSEQFWGREFAYDLLKMKTFEPKRLEEFKKKLFE